MLSGRRATFTNDDGEREDDVQSFGVVTMPKRNFVRPPDTAHERRVIKMRAIRILKDAGFRNHELAIVLDMTERNVRYKLGSLREMAVTAGRV